MTRISWESVIKHAREIVESYDTAVTLRQLFYRLVADGSIPNGDNAYKHLSRLTAKRSQMCAFKDSTGMTLKWNRRRPVISAGRS
jgi:hypothetical protein